jgi:hypothetical protein
MKKTLTIILVIASALLILDSVNFAHAVMLFLLAGVIPGTNILITPAETMMLCALIGGFVLSRTIIPSLSRSTSKKSLIKN